MRVVLVGAGGHAKAIVEAIEAAKMAVDSYVDPKPCSWLKGTAHYPSDEASEVLEAQAFVMGLGATAPNELVLRLDLYRRYRARKWEAPHVVHPTSIVSNTALLGDGCVLLAGVIVQPGAVIGEAAIVNTGAIIEHDSVIGAGSHIGPGAAVLGGCKVGVAAMIGAGAVILPGTEVPDEALVPALTRYLP